MATTGRLAAILAEEGDVQRVRVDAIGLGAGVADRLRELGFRQVVAVNVAERARDPERYAARRDEIYFGLRDRFRAGEIAVRDDRLQAQLAALRYGFTSRGQLKVESKEEMRDRGVPSPDRADALAFAADGVPPGPYTGSTDPVRPLIRSDFLHVDPSGAKRLHRLPELAGPPDVPFGVCRSSPERE